MNLAPAKRNLLVALLVVSSAAARVVAQDTVPTTAAAKESGEFVSRPGIPALLLIAPRDSTPLDEKIRASQLRLKGTALLGPELERLGWLFVAKARASSDPGFYTLAGAAADVLEQDFHLSNEAWLLRGNVLQSRHRFGEAEELGRRLVAARGAGSDYALLGDALYDQGRIVEAADAYQQMVDLKPGLDSYSRAANIRWIKGDLTGAVELQTLAVRAGGAGDPGAVAWSLVRLGQLVWQQGNAAGAATLAARALELVPEFQPALLLQGRLLLAAGRASEALTPLARAAAILPLPEPRWVYAEALRATGAEKEAAAVEQMLVADGVAEDPRTVALFLATHRSDPEIALRLAEAELKNRADIVTHAAVALALANGGRLDEALVHARAALREGTADARLLLYAGRIAALTHQPDAAVLLHGAGQLGHLLLPSEQRLLDDSLALFRSSVGSVGTTENPPKKTS
jgi:tetratricopeptide (TPR) repeat protein